MDHDFSLLSFSPSRIKKTSKLINNNKCSKLALRSRRLIPSDNNSSQASVQNSLPCHGPKVEQDLKKTNVNVKSSVKACDKRLGKPNLRVSKGKENQIGNNVDQEDAGVSFQKDSRLGKGIRRKCTFQNDCFENVNPRKKRSFERSSSHTHSSEGSLFTTKSSVSGDFVYSKNNSSNTGTPEIAKVVVPESSLSSVGLDSNLDRNEGTNMPTVRGDLKVPEVNGSDSVIVISDSSSDSSSVHNVLNPKKQKKSLATVVIETSDSDTDILGKSYEGSTQQNIFRTPLISSTKAHLRKHSKRGKEQTPEVSVNHVLPGVEVPLNHSKRKDIETWLSKIPSLNSSENCEQYSSTPLNGGKNNSNSSSVFNTSIEETLKKFYGPSWQLETPLSERQKKSSDRPQTECINRKKVKPRASLNSTKSEDFEKFMKNIRQQFESTEQKKVQDSGSPFVVEDGSENNSVAFYQAILNETKDEVPLAKHSPSSSGKYSLRRKCLKTFRQLNYSTSNSDPSHNKDTSTESDELDIKTKKKKKVQRSPKVISSPVKRIRKNCKPLQKRQSLNNIEDSNEENIPPDFLAALSSGPNNHNNPEAQFYKENFKKKKEELCQKLFQLYNSQVFNNKLPKDMLIEWNVRMKRTAGYCYNRRTLKSPGTKIRTSRIELSTKVCDTAERLRDTLIHEMCHAATWIIDEIKDGHGANWKAWARKATALFPAIPPIKRCHEYKIHTKFTYRCVGCGYSIHRHSKSLNTQTKRCGYCLGVFELLVNERRQSGTIKQQTVKKRSPVGFARYVKENYKSVKMAQGNIPHAEVMRRLGQQFAAIKVGTNK